ncbi:hypothetical protein GCM10007147_03780 [Nocardiopsis kunsanensis]|uniref:Uncharacterized protein n=1 Tax=Nocardiopsis kunsanensis TaxID=141693 RepID=A0A919CFH7_9ACTN|nr:hypothetical protein [Nocardiopsis kunsanensis]GHD15886.1 hypothetical protein GCM10007147_03780 [Nocardiopsis kunsanensis]
MHPIPQPRTAQPAHAAPRPAQPGDLPGTSCPTCAHSTCRTHRAQSLPRLGGHRAEFSTEHTRAAMLQARHRGLIIFFGEATQSYWVASAAGLAEARTWDGLLAHLWARTSQQHSDS